jgi:uncharacterized membrane protein
MMYRIQRAWDNLQSSLWFVPFLIVGGMIVLAFTFVWVDQNFGTHIVTLLPFFPEAGAAGTREMLSIIGGSVLTLGGVAFSFTIVVFSFASTQYSSRTLRTFMDDNVNQVVLGVILGCFVYCMVVLRSTRLEENAPVPELSASFALLLALASLSLFIIFIHHVAEAIQAYHIISRLAAQTIDAAQHLFPAHIGADSGSDEDARHFSMSVDAGKVLARRSGYIEMVDGDLLMRVLARHDLHAVLEKSVGNYVVEGEMIAAVGPPERVTPRVLRDIEYAFVLGKVRTIFQDAQYGILQLSDVAVKALSPAINDPNTAIMSLNALGNVLRRLASARFPGPYRCDAQGVVRVFAFGQTFPMLVAQAFDQIRRHATLDTAVLLKMLDVISEVADNIADEERLEVLREHARAVREACNLNIRHSRDRALFDARYEEVAETLKLQ